MALHERQMLREATIAALLNKTAAGPRVYKSRRAPIPEATLPVIHVYTDQEPVDDNSGKTAPRELTRRPDLVIEAWVVASADVEDSLDAIALQIETAMDADRFLDGCAFNSWLSNTELGVSVQGARPMGAAQLTYSVIYHTDQRTQATDDARDHYVVSDIKVMPPGTAPDPIEGLEPNLY